VPNILSKDYKGLIHFVNVVLTFAAVILTAPQIVDLDLPWLAPAASGVTAALLFIQRFTKLGDAHE
jgi:hypothetical protein